MVRDVARASPLKQHRARTLAYEGGVVVVSQLKNLEGDGGNGFNAATGEYVDMVKLRRSSTPPKVTRSALQNAASIAALFLTTEAVIVDKPEKEAAAPMGGGMDDY